MAKKAASRTTAAVTPVMKPLSQLQLDNENPRFAEQLGRNPSQTAILDHIVEVHGIENVLSSIGLNGYFHNEPMLAVQPRERDPIVVMEGNRRLAACLVLTGDERAANQARRREPFEGRAGTAIREVPVAIYKTRKELVSYLGVKHIAGAQPWDAYAKASWVARVLEDNPDITLQDITRMIGDKHRTVARLVEGFYFVEQLVRRARFRPEDSVRRGRRSSVQYPFSWIYTILGFSTVREWLGIPPQGTRQPGRDPVEADHLDRAEELVDMMFGNRSKGRNPVIGDSRDLQNLAKAVTDNRIYSRLQKGVAIKTAMDQVRTAGAQISENLTTADLALSQIQVVLGGQELAKEDARRVEPSASEVRTRAVSVHKTILKALAPDDEEET